MLSYKDVEFNDHLIKEITRTIEKASDGDVLNFVKKNKSLARGFQLKKSNAPVLRKKIVPHILTMRELDDDAAEFIYRSGIGQEFICVLSESALKIHSADLEAIFGHDAVTLAFLLDSRREIQMLGQVLLDMETDSIPDKNTACLNMADNLKNFTTHFLTIVKLPETITPPPIGTDVKKINDLERQIKLLQKQNNEQSNFIKEEKEKTATALKEKDDRIEKLIIEKNKLAEQSSKFQSIINNLEDTLKSLQQNFSSNVEAALASKLEGLTFRWLKERIQIEDALALSVTGDLLFQAENALLRQSQIDRHIKNRQELKKQLAEISAKLIEIRDARNNSLHPLLDLETIENQLVVEEKKLMSILGSVNELSHSDIAKSLACRINSSTADEEIHKLEQLVEELHSLGMSNSDFAYLQDRLGDRYDRLVAEHGYEALQVLPTNPALRFRMALGSNEPITLVCDGHNILNSLETFEDVRKRSHTEARKALTDAVSSILRPYQGSSAIIVYDGPDHCQENYSENVVVIYSGGGKNEKHRADKRIEEMLNWRHYIDASVPVFLVTADYALGQEARESGAEVIPLEHFEWMLAEV